MMTGKIAVFIPGQANMVKASLARLLEVRHKPPMDRLTDERFAELVEAARGWLAKAEAIAERAMHDDMARDAYWLYCREADRAIFTARDEPFAQAGARQRAGNVDRAKRDRRHREIDACMRRVRARDGTAKQQWPDLRLALEREGFTVTDSVTAGGGPAYEVDTGESVIRIALKTFQNRKKKKSRQPG